ncbi:hypothetical protein H310_12537 [Aphanomyces invadans]|uniref:PX domain-containing protein n=1 Tax=Aphanomyces invadans TaxID=157072 RepID=A0A024THG3_9STRA|nr:hypothetical protein H310_12537 [Aphanomyces invadans]ETV93493.1 hypothetical protein H310_12537 [Aphanomyces invadans]|eukprot:XP_008877835.1 hypothetical protein H310_12537 [Aphanomyces invadans]
MTTPLKRLSMAARQTSFADLDCSVQGTSICKTRPRALFAPTHVVFLVKLTMPTRQSWCIQCTLHDVARLHRRLVDSVDDTDFQAALSTLRCPRQPLFRRTNALVVKGMCCDLEFYLTTLLKVCQAHVVTATPSAVDVEATMRTFFDTSSVKAQTKAAANMAKEAPCT